MDPPANIATHKSSALAYPLIGSLGIIASIIDGALYQHILKNGGGDPRAALVDHEKLSKLQQACSLVDAEETLRSAFWQDVRPMVREWRKARGLPEDPLHAFRSSGYLERITKERGEKNTGASASYA